MLKLSDSNPLQPRTSTRLPLFPPLDALKPQVPKSTLFQDLQTPCPRAFRSHATQPERPDYSKVRNYLTSIIPTLQLADGEPSGRFRTGILSRYSWRNPLKVGTPGILGGTLLGSGTHTRQNFLQNFPGGGHSRGPGQEKGRDPPARGGQGEWFAFKLN